MPVVSPGLEAALAAAMEEAAHCAGSLMYARVYAGVNPSGALDAMVEASKRASAVMASLYIAANEMGVELDARIAAQSGQPILERRADA